MMMVWDNSLPPITRESTITPFLRPSFAYTGPAWTIYGLSLSTDGYPLCFRVAINTAPILFVVFHRIPT